MRDQIPHRNVGATLFLLLILIFSASESAAEEWKVPPALKSIVETSAYNAADGSKRGDPEPHDLIIEKWNSILLLTVVDALYKPGDHSIHELGESKSRSEVNRSDKRSGVSGQSTVSTTLVEKAGLPRLVSLALARGAASADLEGTNLSVTTTPYALIALFSEDSQSNYERSSTLSKIGLSATFAVDHEESEEDLSSGHNLTEFSGILRLEGDRSTRSKLFNKEWGLLVKPLAEKRVELLSGAQSNVFGPEVEFMTLADSVKAIIIRETKSLLAQHNSMDTVALAHLLSEAALKQLQVWLYEPLVSGTLSFPQLQSAAARNAVFEALSEADSLRCEANAEADRLLKELKSQRVVSIGYTQKRKFNRPWLSEIKLLVDQPVAGNELYVNAFVTLNHRTDEESGEKTLYDYGGSLSWERTLSNVLTKGLGNAAMSQMVVSLDARLSHVEVSNFERFTLQARVTVPLPNGLVFPASLRYDSRGLDGGNSEFQISFGLDLDIDKLIALSQL